MFTNLITKVLDFAKTDTAAKIVLKVVTLAGTAYLHKDISPSTIAYIGTGYLAVSAFIDAWWHTKQGLPTDGTK